MAVMSQLPLSTSQMSLDALIDDVLIHILSLLPAWDVLRLRQTSKRMESLSHVRAVWHALFARDVLTCGRPVPGFSFVPTPRLLQLCALDPAFEDLDHANFEDANRYDVARELVEASDLEARTLHAIRLEKSWAGSTSTSISSSISTDSTGATETRLRTFQTPTPVRDVFLLPGGRFVVSLHADRLRCWDLGVPHALNPTKVRLSSAAGVRCVGEWVLARHLAQATMCVDAHPSAPSVSVYGRRSETSISFAICPDIIPSWPTKGSPTSTVHQIRTCEILSVRLDPLRSGSLNHPSFDLHSTNGASSITGSPFASPVPFFRREAVVQLPVVLVTPSYPEGSVSAETAAGGPWGPQRFARGKLGRLLLMYGSVMFFESFVPPPPAPEERDGQEEAEREDGPKYVGIEVLDWNEPWRSVLFEYPDPQVGPYVALHVHASAAQVIVVWQNCAGIYPLPFRVASSSSLSLSGSASGSSAASSRPSSPSLSSNPAYGDVSKFSCPETSASSSCSCASCSSSGSSRSSLGADPSDMHLDVKIGFDSSDPEADGSPEPKPSRTVLMPTIVFALSEPVEAPVAFSSCSVDSIDEDTGVIRKEKDESDVPHPLTILARSRTDPTRNVQSVLTASPNPQAAFTSSDNTDENSKFTFRLSRIPAPTPQFVPESTSGAISALALGPSGRGVRADCGGALFRCTRTEVVLPTFGFGFWGMGMGAGASAVATVDFWPWRCAAVLPAADSSSSSLLSPSSPPLPSLENETQSQSEAEGERLVLRFDDGMGRVVAARVPPQSTGNASAGEVTVLDFA